MLHHAGMIHRLDPDVPVIWRGPTKLQIGLNRAPLVLECTTPTLERLIGALSAGASSGALRAIAARSGQPASTIDELLELVAPHLLQRPTVSEGQPLSIEAAAESIAPLAAITDREVLSCGTAGPQGPGVLSADYVIRPDRASAWMSAGQLHVAVEFDDDGARVTAPIVPGLTACVRCRLLSRCDHDADFPALASQLSGATASAAGLGFRVAVLALAVARITAVVEYGSGLPAAAADDRSGADVPGTGWTPELGDTRITLGGATRELAPAAVHPQCGCRTPQ